MSAGITKKLHLGFFVGKSLGPIGTHPWCKRTEVELAFLLSYRRNGLGQLQPIPTKCSLLAPVMASAKITKTAENSHLSTPPNMDEPASVANPLSLPSFEPNVSAENRFPPCCPIQQSWVERPAIIFLTRCVIPRSNRSCEGSGSESDSGDVPLTHQSAKLSHTD